MSLLLSSVNKYSFLVQYSKFSNKLFPSATT